MKHINIISSALIALAFPMATFAGDYKYDDEPTVEVGGGEGGAPWEGETPGVEIGVDDGVTTGVRKVETGSSSVEVKFNRAESTITIIAQTQTTVPVYRIGAPAMTMLRVNVGENIFSMPRGIYIIAGRKHML